MKHTQILSLIAVIAAALFSVSCGDDAPESLPVPKPVIEGWIDSDGYPRVIFTLAFTAGEENITIADKMIRWGRVTISDGDRTVVMTGGPDNDLFPPYSYYTYEMKGEPGRTYTITAGYRGVYATAVCRMPQPPEVTELRQIPIEGNDTLRAVSVSIVNNSDETAYYHVATRVIPFERRFLPSVMGCVEAAPGQTVELPVLRGKTSVTPGDFVPQLPSKRLVMLRVEHVTREVFLFWQAFNESTMFGGSQFVGHNTSLPGNIDRGFGVWSAQGSVILRIEPLVIRK